jgi:uncharacterized membrane protein YdbT with pleckstrin-like domain
MDFINHNWKDYLKDGDKVQMHAQIERRLIAWRTAIAGLLALVFLGVPSGIASFARGEDGPVAILIGLLIAITVGFVARARMRGVHYALTASGVYSIDGLFFKNARFVAYARITDAAVQRGILEQMFGLGSVGISTAGGTKSSGGHSQPYEIRISGVTDYQKIRQSIFKRMK